MDALEAMENLVRRARLEQPPATDVAAAAIGRIRAGAGRPAVRILPLSLLAAAAAVAAVVVLALAVQAWTAPADPQTVLFPTVEVAAL
jgi:hypothetical protein